MAIKLTLANIFSLLLLISGMLITNQVAKVMGTACKESWRDVEGCKEVGYLTCKRSCVWKHGFDSYGFCEKSSCICYYTCSGN
ncbi:hypothetical protein HN51_053442 [Arachis hypogaea]